MFKHLLLPLDGSRLAEAALPSAKALAQRFDSKITLLAVVRVPYMAVDVGGHAYTDALLEMHDQAHDQTLEYLREKQQALQREGYRVNIEMGEGEPVAEIILETVEQVGADTIVMSTHGRGGVSRWVFGSVADKVLQQASVPVLLVRAKEEVS